MSRYIALGRWRPDHTDIKHTTDLIPGNLVAFGHRAWRVLAINPSPPELVKDDGKDWHVIVRNANDPDTATAKTGDRSYSVHARTWWNVYPDEHYPVCRTCQEPTPCRHLVAEKTFEVDVQRTRRYEMADVCPACQEVVTRRQLAQTWPENLYVPLGPPVRFHLRGRCIREAQAYDAAWRASGQVSRLGYTEQDALIDE